MTSQQKRRDKKAKARENKAKERVLRRREKARKAAKIEKLAKRVEQDSRPKMTPYRKDQDEEYQTKKSKENLERNIEILHALEEQYRSEMEGKQSLNDELEAEGYDSLEEKMNALHKQAIEIAEKHEKDSKEKERLADTKAFVEEQQVKLASRKKKKKDKLSGGAKYRFSPTIEEDTAGLGEVDDHELQDREV